MIFIDCDLKGVSCKVANNNQIIIPLGMNFSELLNIQKRDCPFLGPSFINSWPSPFPHFPQRTWRWTSEHLSQVILHSFSILTRSRKRFHSQGFLFFCLFPADFTLYARGLSSCLETLSSWMVSVKAGHGDECSYLVWLENSS